MTRFSVTTYECNSVFSGNERKNVFFIKKNILYYSLVTQLMIVKLIFTLKENNKVELVSFLGGVSNVCRSDSAFAQLATIHN